MTRVGLFYHPDFLKHRTGAGHPERPERLSSLMKHLLSRPVWNVLAHVQPQPATMEHVTLVHPERHVKSIAEACRSGETVLDAGDTHVGKDSYNVALLAAGAAIDAVDQVMEGKLSSAFCAIRPPGHHAETATAMGFCLLNNVAIAARHAKSRYTLNRIAIIDWDVHHGNGTQEIFYEDPSVFYVSLHQYPFYPGTGSEAEIGRGKGEGYTLNIPMSAGSGETQYMEAFRDRVLPALARFNPELILLSAGFDAHRNDPLAGMELTERSFALMTESVMELAAKVCGGRIVSVLEGGYDLDALSASIEVHLETLTRA